MLTEKAKELYKYFDYKTMDDESKRVICTADFDSKEWVECMELLRRVDDNTTLSMDSRYEFTMEALGLIADANENEEELDELSTNIEADIYTHDLTAWLAQSNYHVEYITEAIQEYGTPDNGFQLLAMAQAKAKEEVFYEVLGWLKENATIGNQVTI